jgi:hypothetical protein
MLYKIVLKLKSFAVETLEKIAFDIKRINDDKELYKKINSVIFDELVDGLGLSYDLYLQRIKRFYEKDYDFR